MSAIIREVPRKRPWYLGFADCLSSIMAVLIVSNGVTATTDSRTPAPKPAMTPLVLERLPSSSRSACLMESKPKNRTPALKVLPTKNAGQPVYKDPTPCALAVL